MVSIEFALVVLGVLLAFQINEWATQSSNAAERRTATERLLEESERSLAYNRQAVDFERTLLAGLGLAIDRLTSGSWPASDEGRMVAGLGRARAMVALAPPSTVYDDLVSSGDLNKIGTPALRASIGRYRSTLSFEERMRQQLLGPLPAFERIDAFSYKTDPRGKERMQLLVDFPQLLRDREARQLIALTAENHRILLMLRTRALRDNERMCIALGQEVGRACNRSLPPPIFD